jgi:hypothetical protein
VLGEPASIAIVERFIRSMKQECFRLLLLVPMTLAAVRRELGCYASSYNEYRPHTTLSGSMPQRSWSAGKRDDGRSSLVHGGHTNLAVHLLAVESRSTSATSRAGNTFP